MNDMTYKAVLRTMLGDERLMIFDIGARGGLHPRWNKFYSVIEAVGFEPDKAECDALNESSQRMPYRARFLPFALGKRAEQGVKFYVCRQPGCSSIYQPNTEFIRDFAFAPAMAVERTVTLDTVTLSDVSAQERLQPDCIKIDVQGAELDILKGSVALLPSTKLIELEVEFNPQYRGQPLFHDIDNFMRQQGWVLLGLRRDYWRRMHGLQKGVEGCGGLLMHGDALYYNPQCFNSKINRRSEVLKFLIALSAYRQNDFVLSLLRDPGGELGRLSEKERATLERSLVHYPGRLARLFRWSARGIDHKTRRRLVDALQYGDAGDWHDADFY